MIHKNLFYKNRALAGTHKTKYYLDYREHPMHKTAIDVVTKAPNTKA